MEDDCEYWDEHDVSEAPTAILDAANASSTPHPNDVLVNLTNFSVWTNLLQTCMVVVVVMGLALNIMQFVSVCQLLKCKRISKIGGRYLRMQALFDGAVCLVIIPVSFNEESMPLPRTPFPKLTVVLAYVVCHVWYSQYFFWQFQVYSVINLTLLSIDRFVVIKFSMKHSHYARRQRPLAVVLFLFGFTLAAISSLYCTVEVRTDNSSASQPVNSSSSSSSGSHADSDSGSGSAALQDNVFLCTMGSQLFSETFTMWYSLVWFMAGYAVPALIMIGCYAFMIASLVREKNTFQSDASCTRALTIRNVKMRYATRQLIKTVILMGVSFILCLCLDSVATLLTALGLYPYVFNTPLQKLGMMLIAVNCATGPGITFLLIPTLRKISIMLVRRTLCCAAANDDSIAFTT